MSVDFKAMGQRIAKRRKVLNLTQEEVAEMVGITPSHVRNIERAYTKCSIETMFKICQALEVTPDHLFIGAVKPVDENQMASVIASLKLCNERQINFIASFITCVVDEKYP